LSDNFTPLIDAVFARHALPRPSVLANELTFQTDRITVGFPHRDPACPRCAHCKGRQIRMAAGRTRLFVGDGYSDVCAARVADIVFAKDSLARCVKAESRAYRPFESLADVLAYLNEANR